MGGYADEYEDLDEYEDEYAEEEEYEEEEEEEEEEDPQQTQEVQDYLVLRQRLKEAKREKLKKELGIGNANSRDKKNLISRPKDNFGSFFGSSRPVIAQRVIQESKSLLENPNMLAKAMKSKHMVNKSAVPVSNNTKSQASGPSPKVSNGMHKKVQMLKDARDYSFLESDDAQLPVPAKDPPRKVSAPKSGFLVMLKMHVLLTCLKGTSIYRAVQKGKFLTARMVLRNQPQSIFKCDQKLGITDWLLWISISVH